MSLLASPPYRPITGSRPGPMLVLEGVSGIGKSTVARLLAERLRGTALHTLTEPHTGWSATANAFLRPLPQFAFYLSGLLHVSEVVREQRAAVPVIADRYRASVIACHSAVHNLDVRAVTHLMQSFDYRCEVMNLGRRIRKRARRDQRSRADPRRRRNPVRDPRLAALRRRSLRPRRRSDTSPGKYQPTIRMGFLPKLPQPEQPPRLWECRPPGVQDRTAGTGLHQVAGRPRPGNRRSP